MKTDTPKKQYKLDTRRDSKDHRLWRKFVMEYNSEGRFLFERVTDEWKLSRFIVDDALITQTVHDIMNEKNMELLNPKLLFFVGQYYFKQKNLFMFKKIIEICKKRREGGEFDTYGDWIHTDELIV